MQYQHEVGSPGLILRPLEPGDLGWVVQRHGLRYAAEYGWDVTFEGLVARIVAGFAERGDDKREAAWIAEMDGERVGCVFCAAAEAISTAQLRLLLVEPPARGAGVGTRLLNECLGFAARSGYTRDHAVDSRCATGGSTPLPAGRIQTRHLPRTGDSPPPDPFARAEPHPEVRRSAAPTSPARS